MRYTYAQVMFFFTNFKSNVHLTKFDSNQIKNSH